MAYEKEMMEYAIFKNMTKEEQIEHFGYTTQRGFADAYGLPHEKICSEWNSSKKFQKLKRDLFFEGIEDILPDARKTLAIRGVQDGDVSALKEIFKIAGVSIERVEQVSSDDIQELIHAVRDTVKEVLDAYPDLQKEFLDKLGEKLGED